MCSPDQKPIHLTKPNRLTPQIMGNVFSIAHNFGASVILRKEKKANPTLFEMFIY